MESHSAQPGWPPRCARCGDVIGIYELSVSELGGELVSTGHRERTELDRSMQTVAHFHSACAEG